MKRHISVWPVVFCPFILNLANVGKSQSVLQSVNIFVSVTILITAGREGRKRSTRKQLKQICLLPEALRGFCSDRYSWHVNGYRCTLTIATSGVQYEGRAKSRTPCSRTFFCWSNFPSLFPCSLPILIGLVNFSHVSPGSSSQDIYISGGCVNNILFFPLYPLAEAWHILNSHKANSSLWEQLELHFIFCWVSFLI